MKNVYLRLLFILFTLNSCTQTNKVLISNNEQATKFVVNGENFMINGMNWDYFPIGTNHTYSLWQQPDDFIKTALDTEMTLLKNMGVNTIRVYIGIQPKWIKYIYENHGIYTMLNHPFGRYGVSVNDSWIPVTDYRDVDVQEILLAEVTKIAETYKDTPGLLLYLLGNENNYGLFWAGAETENFPESEEKKRKIGEIRGRSMYKLMNDAAIEMKKIDVNHPIAICNGDLMFLDIVAEECKNIDIYGTNMYRGKSFVDAFEKVKKILNKPMLITEFGSDAFNAIENKEDQEMQAYYLVENWKEIYMNAAGLGKVGNSIGGFTFQFSDGWWKFGQSYNLDVHDNNASWSNEAYQKDFKKTSNNMNEEWFGICAKGKTNDKGYYKLQPRAAYYALKEAHQLNPYSKGITIDSISKHFSKIKLSSAILKAKENLLE